MIRLWRRIIRPAPRDSAATAEFLQSWLKSQTELYAAQADMNALMRQIIADHAGRILAAEAVLGVLLRELHADPGRLRIAALRDLSGDSDLAVSARSALDCLIARLAGGRPL